MTADDWNANHGLHTLVTAHLGGPPLQTETRSNAWNPGDGDPVVLVRGIVGGVRLSHIRTREEAS